MILKDVLRKAECADGTRLVMADGTSSFRRVPTETRVGKRTGVEWCGGEIGAGRVGAPVVEFDDGCVESGLVAVALLGGALGALAVGWNEVGGAADTARAVVTSIKSAKKFSFPAPTTCRLQCEMSGIILGANR